ncbi:hypothetical protein [Streptomyces sp. NK08204]|uniref:hypothetical protein n=1 Tax=Streptomyces sp. NK08204 TaxID=2873260 RepID=UPI001CEC1F8D|nr:hypothetical protein [Streptomyces sp. NK08204]
MSENTPSQAEGEPEPTTGTDGEPEQSGRRDVPRTTPSQAEGDDEDDDEDGDGDGDAQGHAGWSGP